MATLPATAAGEVRRIIRIPNGDGTDSPAQGYAWLYPNLRPGTTYRASSVDPQIATKTLLTFDGAGNLEDPETGTWAKVLASDAPGASFPGMQWVLEYHLENVSDQPARQYFTVPANSFVNVDLLADTSPQPAVQTVYVDSAPIIAAANTTDTAVANLFSTATTTRNAVDGRYVQPAVTDALDTRIDVLEATRTRALYRVMSAQNAFSATTWTDFPVAADATALALTFTKAAAANRLIVHIAGTAEPSANGLWAFGVRVGSTDYEVARFNFQFTAPARRSFAGVLEITGVAAGAQAIKPRVMRVSGSGSLSFWTGDDFISYSVTESV